MNSVEAYTFYEHIRHRLPVAEFPSSSRLADNLAELIEEIDVFVFDAFGVLNVGDEAVAGARLRIDFLRQHSKQVFVLTNGASNNRLAGQRKFEKLGFEFSPDEIISSRAAAEQALLDKPQHWHWGIAARSDFSEPELEVSCSALLDDPQVYEDCDAFLFLSSSDWNESRQQLLASSLERRPRLVVVANPDVVAPFPGGFSLEPGFYSHTLADNLPVELEFHGKPFGSVFQMLEDRLQQSRQPVADKSRIAMIGDTLHTDVLGACARGWQSVLVTDHGLFRGMQADDFIRASEIVPHWIVPTI